MNEKEIAEIRRRFKPDKTNIATIRGCYVNEKGEIVTQFSQPLSLMQEDESEKFLSILKKTLSGTLGKNLVDIEFSTQQVVEGDEHKLLMALKDSGLKDEEAVQAFFQRTIETVTLGENYVILLGCDHYDVPYRSRDGERQDDASSEVFTYILCSICPVKLTKPALSYYIYENEFHSRPADWIVSPPELGFIFPSFDDRSANIYNSLLYTRDITETHEEFIARLFNSQPPMPAAEQKETFQAALRDALAEECSFEVVESVHRQINEMIEVHKENKEPEPLTLSKGTVKQILRSSGVSDNNIEAFSEQFDDDFGADTTLSPRNIVDSKKIDIVTPNIKIQVGPGCADLVETRIIDGARYILIRAEDTVELNGVPIHILQ